MKYFVAIALVICCSPAFSQTRKLSNAQTADGTVYAFADKMPRAGYDINDYLSKNIHYPAEAKAKGIQGKVIMQFIVKDNGSITDIKVLRGIGGGCDEEAKRVLENMPPWKPGEMKGKPVSVKFTQPIFFKQQK